jgi:hypothetical protein
MTEVQREALAVLGVSGGQEVSHFGGHRRATVLRVDRGHACPGAHSGATSPNTVP